MRIGLAVSVALFAVSVAVLPGCSDTLEILTTTLPDGKIGTAYNVQLEAKNADEQWSLASGGLPPGIGLTSNGKLSGTPTRAGVFSFTVQVVKHSFGATTPSRSASQGLTLTVR